MSLALAVAMTATPAYAEEPIGDAPVLPVAEQADAADLPGPGEVQVPDAQADALSAVDPAPTLPPVFWPGHGAENGLIHLTGALFVESPDGVVRTGSSEVRLMAEDAPGVVISRIHGSTFAFYDLHPGREYYLELGYGEQPVYVGAMPTPYREDARSFTETTYELAVVLPTLATVSGTIGPVSPSRELTVQALRYDEARGDFDSIAIDGTYTGDYRFGGLFPGVYIFRGSQGASPRALSDEYYPDGDHFEDAVPLEIAAGATVTEIDFTLPEAMWWVYRLAGENRYATSVEISKATFEPGIPVLYLASGANWPDALSAGPAASARGGSLLLTGPTTLPDVTRDEIKRLAPQRVVVVGSSASVSDGVLAQVEELVPDVTRIGGVDRFDTSRKLVADAFGPGPYETVFLATGANFPDALSAGPIAGRLGVPVLLVSGWTDRLDGPTRTALESLAPRTVSILGSTASISDGIEQDVAGMVDSVRRFGGVDRFDTNIWLNNVYLSSRYLGLSYFANSSGFADALAGATAAAAYGAPIYLTPSTCVHAGLLGMLESREWDRVVLLGGEPSLGPAVARMESCEW